MHRGSIISTVADKKQYHKQDSWLRDGGSCRRPTTRSQQNETATIVAVGRSYKRKCFVCGKKYFPFCVSMKGVCNICEKNNDEASHLVATSSRIKNKLKEIFLHKKREFAVYVVMNFNWVFGVKKTISIW